MKKIIVAVAFVCAAAVLNGATVNWSSAAFDIGPAPISDAPRNVYLVWSATEMSSLAGSITINGNGVDAIGGTVNNGGTIVAWHNFTAEEAGTGRFADVFKRSDADGGVNGYYQILMADAANNTFTAVDVATHITGVADNTGAGTVDYNSTFTEGYAKFIGQNGYTGTIQVAPEPTSGLLLLLGVAGLALRRRRA